MRTMMMLSSMLLLAGALVTAGAARAETGGCLKYGAAGAVAGHAMGHGVKGAMAGCVTGMVVRHQARKNARVQTSRSVQPLSGNRGNENGTYTRTANATTDGNGSPWTHQAGSQSGVTGPMVTRQLPR